MPRGVLFCIVAANIFGSTACADSPDAVTPQRTLSGGAIGAAGGAIVTALAGGSIFGGALLGGAAGAAIGALTTTAREASVLAKH